ncbi:indole-3-glycerol-phosphate synthase [Desulfonatronospira sp.]|uniref:indole-3-glycerol phosphate synthase TrpC n=1 Tax=Desulfonatronospira sp. TaxID=1962951 RepID=UPI0025C05116|nr:indole-3-glycerol-phosphate synthase [Desulfonatronospira sp.]
MLDKFIQAKSEELQQLREQKAKGKMPAAYQGRRPDFRQAVTGPGPDVIAEYKRASPSKGVINLSLTPQKAVQEFITGGAAAFSVLTEEKYFQGSLEYLEVFAGHGLPVLRKDFIFDHLQVEQTAATPASALLLIARVVKDLGLLSDLIRMSFGCSLEPVVEIFSAGELDMARYAGARTIMVNNRDLNRLTVDLDMSRSLVPQKKPQEVWICASGIDNSSQVDELHGLGFDAFLIGTSIMSCASPGEKIKGLFL